MKRLYLPTGIVGLAMAALVVVAGAQEQQEQHEKEKHQKPELQEVTVTGQLTKEERTVEKEGQQKTETVFVVTTAEGTKVKLPAPKKDSGINLEAWVGKEVKVVGMGLMKPAEGDKPARIMIHSLVSVTEAAPAPAPAP